MNDTATISRNANGRAKTKPVLSPPCHHKPAAAMRPEETAECERTLLAHLLSPNAYSVLHEAEPLRVEWFFDEIRGRMWQAMRDQHSRGLPLDPALFSRRLLDHHSRQDIADEMERIYALQHSPIMPRGDVAYWAQKIRECSEHRERQGLYQDAAIENRSQEEVRAGLEAITAAYNADPKDNPWKFIPAAELDAMDIRLEYLVHNTLVKDQLCVVAGPSKAMKTTTSIALSLAMASGSPFLDRFDVPRRVRVALASAESGLATIQETQRRMAHSQQIPIQSLQLVHNDRVPRFEKQADMGEFCRQLRGEGIEVAIIDPLYRCVGRDDPGNLAKQGQIIADAADQILECGATPILVHHTIKRPPYEQPLELTDIRDSGVVECMRQWILVSRRSRYQFDGSHELWLAIGGSAGHSHCWAADVYEGQRDNGRVWDVERLEQIHELRAHQQEDKQRQKAEKDENDKWEALERVRQNPDIAKTTLRDQLGWGSRRLEAALEALGPLVERTVHGNSIRYTVPDG